MAATKTPHRDAARELFSSGRVAEAVAALQKRIAAAGENPHGDDLKLLALYQFTHGDIRAALQTSHAVVARQPGDAETLKNIGICHTRMLEPEQAVQWLEKSLAIDPQDPGTHDGLAHAWGLLGRQKQMRKHGEQALLLKAEAMKGVKPLRKLANVKVPPFRSGQPERNVIAFSLWGTQYRYCAGAVENARLARDIYPDWQCRFYCDDSVPSATIGSLLALGAEIVMMPRQTHLHEGLFWRFHACWDPAIDRYLVRDADSLLNVRERLAVDEWIAGRKHFHILRDFYTHTDLILAGLWGGVRGALPDLAEAIARFLARPDLPRTSDQNFLREVIWPIARQSYLLHDSHFTVLKAVPFPVRAGLPQGVNLGQNMERLPQPKIGAMRVLDGKGMLEPRQPRRRFVFTITPGRSGTAYLAELLRRNLPRAEVHHERANYQSLGVHSPDASHFMLFNSVGNVPPVQEFWRRKLGAIMYGKGDSYVEVSHFLAKAGLLENIGLLGPDCDVHVIGLNRNIESVVWSLANRMDFANAGFTWLFALDPRYPRNIVNTKVFDRYGMFGNCFWYTVEMRARAEYYRRVLKSVRNVRFHNAELDEIATKPGAARLLNAIGTRVGEGAVILPQRQNELRHEILAQKDRDVIVRMIASIQIDPASLADQFIASGRRIG